MREVHISRARYLYNQFPKALGKQGRGGAGPTPREGGGARLPEDKRGVPYAEGIGGR